MHRGGADETETDDRSGQSSHVGDGAYSVAENGCVPVLHVRAGVQRYGVVGQGCLHLVRMSWRR